jgi:rhamnogalacturonan endolyase
MSKKHCTKKAQVCLFGAVTAVFLLSPAALRAQTQTSGSLSINTSNPSDWIISNGALTIDYNSNSGAIWSVVPAGTSDQLIDFDPGESAVNGSVFDAADGESAVGGTPLPATWSGPTGIEGRNGPWNGSTPPNPNAAWPAYNEPKGFYMDLSGFSGGTNVPGYQLTANYLDFWVTTTAVNNFIYAQHFIVTPNDPGIHIYFTVSRPGSYTGSSSIGQVQWIFRDDTGLFTNLYNVNADLSMNHSVITPLPSVDDCFSSDDGRNVQDTTGRDTIDLHPQVGVTNAFSPYTDFPPGANVAIPEGFHRHFCVKYDYSSYEYLHPAHGLFGSKYGLWVVFTPGHDTFIGGPEKQNLDFTGGILTIEPLSDHYMTGGLTVTSAPNPGNTQYVSGTTLTNRIFGPFYVRINKFGGDIRTPDDMYEDAITAGTAHSCFQFDPGRQNFYRRSGASCGDAQNGSSGDAAVSSAMPFENLYDNDAELVASGFVPFNTRGDVNVDIGHVEGAPKTAWAVLSQNGENQIVSAKSYQYVMDISRTGQGTFHDVVPGTYRLSVFDLGKFGEYRDDNVVVTGDQATVVPTVSFQPEDFGRTVWTIGTPDRSAHEFLHGHDTYNPPFGYEDQPYGFDDREYWGNWNYWADFASTDGAVIYNATSGPNGPATNNPEAWNYAHCGTFDPGIYGGAYVASDDSTDGYMYEIPSYVSTLSGASGTNGVNTPTPPWQIHFTTESTSGYNYVVLTQGLAATQAGETISLNGNPLSYTPASTYNSDAYERSGLSGYYEWVAFQWPVADLNPPGKDNVITVQVSSPGSCNMDDALRFELSANGAQPSVTGWNDYTWVTSSTTIPADDTVPNP